MSKDKMQVVYKSVDELIPYVNNARTHSDKQISQIAASIKEFGFNNPILLDGENGMVAGHGRLMGAKKLKMKEVPCIELSHLSESQKKAYILADNKIALNAEWDIDLLEIEIQSIKNAEIDTMLLGFNEYEISDMLNNISDSDIDIIEDIKEGVNFTVKCENIEELNKLKNLLNTAANKIDAEKLLEILQ